MARTACPVCKNLAPIHDTYCPKQDGAFPLGFELGAL